jgi:hypothetical protein
VVEADVRHQPGGTKSIFSSLAHMCNAETRKSKRKTKREKGNGTEGREGREGMVSVCKKKYLGKTKKSKKKKGRREEGRKKEEKMKERGVW